MRGEDGVAEAVEVLQGLFTGRETLEST
jgi:hypothetical protein